MADLGNTSGLFAARMAGAVSGAAISLIYMLPRSEREALCRFLAGLVSGVIFGGPVGVWLAVRMGIADMLSPPEIALSGAAAVSLCSWWALGLLERLAKRWGGEKG